MLSRHIELESGLGAFTSRAIPLVYKNEDSSNGTILENSIPTQVDGSLGILVYQQSRGKHSISAIEEKLILQYASLADH